MLLFALGIAFALWIACVGPLRTWAWGAGVRAHWFVGVAPSLFAGATFVFFQAVVTRTGALYSGALSVGLTLLAEGAQLMLPASTADWGDVAAGVAGAAFAVPIVAHRLSRVGTDSNAVVPASSTGRANQRGERS